VSNAKRGAILSCAAAICAAKTTDADVASQPHDRELKFMCLDFSQKLCHVPAPSEPVTGWRTAAERLYRRQDEEPDAP
jgi:hypothetical protein